MNRSLIALSLLVASTCREQPAAEVAPAAATIAPAFDVAQVIRAVHLAYREVPTGFEGGHATYQVNASREGVFAVTPRSGTPVTLQTLAIEGARGIAAAKGSLSTTGSLEFNRGSIIEHISNSESGLEQQWALERRPEGSDDLTVRVRLAGLPFVKESARGLHFGDVTTGIGFIYGKATWVDANGISTPVTATHAGDEVLLTVPRALLNASAFPAVLDPVLTPEFALDTPVNGPGIQNYTGSIAFDGTNFMLVWVDNRQADAHIYATRISQNGVVLDTAGIAIGTSTRPQFSPSIAFTNGQYLVAWEESGNTNRVWASRVSTAGVVLDPAGIAISGSSPFWDEGAPAVSGDGTNFVVAYEYDISSGGNIKAVRIGPSGNRLDTTPVLVATASATAGGTQMKPVIAFVGTGWLISWYDYRGTSWDIYANVLTSAGTVANTAGFAVSATTLGEYNPSIAFDGTNALIAWNEDASGTDSTVFARRVSPAGALLDTTAITLSTAAGKQTHPRVVFDGTNYLVAWDDARNGRADIYGTRVSPTGTVLDSAGLALMAETPGENGAVLAVGGGRALMAWTDYRNGQGTVYAGRYSLSGTAQDANGFPVAATPNAETNAAVAFDGTNYFVTWQDTRLGSFTIYGTRVSPQGAILDPSGIAISAVGSTSTSPQLAFNGANYLVAWPSGSQVLGRLVSPTGSVLGTADLVLPLSQTPRDIAAAGSTFLAVANVSGGNGFDVQGVRVSGAGVVLDSTPISITAATGNQFLPRVASDGTGFFVVWHDTHIYGARVTTAGVVLDTTPVLISGSTGNQSYAAIDFDGTNYAVVWQDGVIWGTRVSPSGVVLDTPALTVASRPSSYDVLGEPLISFDGTNHVVSWNDTKLNTSFTIIGYSVDALRVSPSLAVLDTRVTVASSPSRRVSYVMASDRAGGTLFTYVAATTLGGVATDRIKARIFSGTPPVGACTSAGQCSSGFCVDGRCCNTACGNGSTTDCVACSIAAGAAVDGTCGSVANSRSCDDNSACTSGDVCTAGSCSGTSSTTCSGPGVCQSGGACVPASGLCAPLIPLTGTACPGGICAAGTCVPTVDGGRPDAGVDAGRPDAGIPDAGFDAGVPRDSGTLDSGTPGDAGAADAGPAVDGGDFDAGHDADAGDFDAGANGFDAGQTSTDAGPTMQSSDGGMTPTTPTGCGCGVGRTSPELAALLLVIVAVARSRQRPHLD